MENRWGDCGGEEKTPLQWNLDITKYQENGKICSL